MMFRFNGTWSGHYDEVVSADRELANKDDGAAALGSFGDEVKAGELPVPLGVGGHCAETSDRNKSNSVTKLTRNCDEKHIKANAILHSYYRQ